MYEIQGDKDRMKSPDDNLTPDEWKDGEKRYGLM